MNLRLHAPSLRSSAYALLAIPLCGFMVSGGPSYAPEPEASDTQSWEVTHSMSLAEITVELASGNDVPSPEIEMKATRSRTVTMDQVHESAQDGAPTSLRRSFVGLEDSLEGSFSIKEDDLAETLDAKVESLLTDQSVRLTWSDEDEEWSAVFVDEDGEAAEGSPDDLAGLVADAHLGGLLANLEEPREKATWTADATVLAALVCPGGKLHAEVNVSSSGERGMEPALVGLDPLLGMELWDLLGDEAAEFDGGIDCQVLAMSSDVMSMGLKVDVTSTSDVSEKLARWIKDAGMPWPVDVSRGEAVLQAEGQGSVTWNLKTGLPVKVDLELELAYTLQREAAFSIPGQEDDVITTEVNLIGTLSSTMTAE